MNLIQASCSESGIDDVDLIDDLMLLFRLSSSWSLLTV